MDHETYIDKETRTIYCTLAGEFNIEESISLSKSLREKAAGLGFNVLYEASKLQEPQSNMPVYDFTVRLSSILDATSLRNVKVAFIYKPGAFDEYWQFYENTSVNRGLNIKVFTDREDATKWLSS